MERPKAPGLKFRSRQQGAVPYWRAPTEAIAKGFTPPFLRLRFKGWESDERICAAMLAHCHRLQAEAMLFISDRPSAAFDETFGALIDRYLKDPESSFARLKPSSVHPYEIYAEKLRQHIGEIRIDLSDGRDVQRWFKVWAGVDNLKHPDARLPRARMMLAVLKAAVSFGVICRLDGCAAFSAILSELEFPSTRRRAAAPTAAQVEAARTAAHAVGARSRALAYALQFETTLRQWDVIGVWVKLSDPRPSSVIDGDEKWIGPTWAMVDDQLVLRITYGKTEGTSGLRGSYDLSVCPMVVEELQHARRPRIGPLIVDEKTGLPYRERHFQQGWKADFKAAGLSEIWNRDLRAGAITEAGMVGADPNDTRKIAGHTTVRQVATVYDRDTLEAQRRVARLRKAARKEQ